MKSLDQQRRQDRFRSSFAPTGYGRILAIVNVLLCGAVGALAQPGNWQTLQFPSSGTDSTYCFGMNPSGDMVGTYRIVGVATKGFLLSQGSYSGPLPGQAHGINARGDIVGYDSLSNGKVGPNGYLLSGGVLTILMYPGVAMTHPWDINPQGQIVGGYMATTSSKVQGFLRSKDGTFTDIQYPGADGTFPFGISPQGDMVGEYYNGSVTHGFLRSKNGNFIRLDFPGATVTSAYKINARGEIVGYYWDSNSPSQSHGFLWQNGLFTTVDYPGATHTMIHGLNSEGEMCGMVSFSPVGQAIVWGGFARTW